MGCCDCDAAWEDVGDRCAGSRCCSICAGYPSQWTCFFLCLLPALTALVVSLYAYIRLKTSVLDYSFDIPWRLFLNSGLAGIAASGLLLVLAAFTWASFFNDNSGYCFKALYIAALLVVSSGFALATIGGYFVSLGAKGVQNGWEKELKRVWLQEVQNENSTSACLTQARLNCDGFDEGDCLVPVGPDADQSTCATRCSKEDAGGESQLNNVLRPGCKDRMNSFYARWYLVLAIGCSIATLATLTNVLIVVTGVSFRKRKQRQSLY